MFELILTLPVILSGAVMVVTAVWLLTLWRGYVASVSRRVALDSAVELPEGPTAYPQVSIVVFSDDDADRLRELLPVLLTQDYPEQYEVIVVNDGGLASIKDVIARLEQTYSNLYMTFTPLDSRSLSRKKLAVTLGIKAARYEVVVHTTGSCRVTSPHWLRRMTRHFAEGKEVVIGYAYPVSSDPDEAPDPSGLQAFSFARTAVEYLSWAIASRPYRANACNMAYRRSVFFKANGFSKLLSLKYGDDDVFINQVTTPSNTAVELSEESMVEMVMLNPQAMLRHDKLRYDFTARLIRRGAPIFFASCSWMWWLQIAAAAVMVVFGLPSLIPAIAAAFILLATWITMMIVWRRTARALRVDAAFLTLPWMMSVHPFYTLVYRWRGWRKRKSNYTWQ